MITARQAAIDRSFVTVLPVCFSASASVLKSVNGFGIPIMSGSLLSVLLPQAVKERIVRSIIITANNLFIVFPFHFYVCIGAVHLPFCPIYRWECKKVAVQ